jgi:nitrous oxide reductase accessory protein NosL
MKKTLAFALILSAALAACSKSATNDAVSLSASSTSVAVGEPVTITVNNGAATRWSVTPAASVTKLSSTGTQSQFSFATEGTYVVGIRTGDTSGHRSCTAHVDSASVQIVVARAGL